jgi:hypothetical protein
MNFDTLIKYNLTQIKISENGSNTLFNKPIDKPFWVYVNLKEQEFKGIPFYNKTIIQVVSESIIEKVKDIEETHKDYYERKAKIIIEEDVDISGF